MCRIRIIDFPQDQKIHKALRAAKASEDLKIEISLRRFCQRFCGYKFIVHSVLMSHEKMVIYFSNVTKTVYKKPEAQAPLKFKQQN